jgi:hypothetical protein
MILSNGDFRAKDIRHGTKKAAVEVEFTDGSKIRRERTASTQQLTVTLPDGEVKGPYAKYSDMTDLVQSVSGVKPVNLTKGESSDFIQLVSVDDNQHFLVGGVNPATVLKRINKLAGGAGIEVTKQKLTTQLKALVSNHEFLEGQYNAAQEELAIASEVDFYQLEEIKQELTKQQAILNGYCMYKTNLERIERDASKLTSVEPFVKQNAKLKPMIADLESESTVLVELYEIEDILLTSVSEIGVALNKINTAKTSNEELAPQIESLEQVVKQEEIQKALELEKQKQVQQVKTTNVCPMCNRAMESNA